MVVFATPAFCVSATCGPQLSELGKVKEEFGGRANFVHVEVFKDPHLITGGRPTAGLVPAVGGMGAANRALGLRCRRSWIDQRQVRAVYSRGSNCNGAVGSFRPPVTPQSRNWMATSASPFLTQATRMDSP